jgi:hypothetical protein
MDDTGRRKIKEGTGEWEGVKRRGGEKEHKLEEEKEEKKKSKGRRKIE